ncbi:protein E31 [Elephant endotheliotropic herpesvirus 2]|nr:protein E31 [Elephant endotheliotropic herpesvirus 2]
MLKSIFLGLYIFTITIYLSTLDEDVCSSWTNLIPEIEATLQETEKRKKRDVNTDTCDLESLKQLSGGIMVSSTGRKKRNSEPEDYHKCLQTKIMKCFFDIDHSHLYHNDTHIIGNITVDLTYYGNVSNIKFNVSKLHVPLIHFHKITSNHFKARNNTWPWCTPDVPGKKLEILWNDTLIPFKWLNATEIYVGAFGFEFLDGENVTALLSRKK